MTENHAPLPPVDDVTRPWWDATREGRLIIQHCDGCGHFQHYPRRICTGCGATDRLGWREVGGVATVDGCTVIHRSPRPDVAAPYLVARVRLAEGPVILANLVDTRGGLDDPDSLVGAGVELRWRELADGRKLPVFTIPTRGGGE